MKKISYSAYKKYHTCPKLYEFHYKERLRPNFTTSALIFGSAIDDALNELLTGTEDALETYKKSVDGMLQENSRVIWDIYDFDVELIDSGAFENLNHYGTTLGYTGNDLAAFVRKAVTAINDEGLDTLSENQYALISAACLLSLECKAQLIIDEYKKTILPMIDEVHSVQAELSDTTIRGILDVDATVNGQRIIIDHKTSKRPYKAGAANLDPQLILYAADQGVDKVGFVVMVKNINKNKEKKCKSCGYNGSGGMHKTCPNTIDGTRCHGTWEISVRPQAYIQYMEADISNVKKDLPREAINDTLKSIEGGHFPRNLSACNSMYGKPCPYLNKCWNNDETNLIKKED